MNRNVLITLVFSLVVLLAVPVYGQMEPWNGLWIKSSEILTSETENRGEQIFEGSIPANTYGTEDWITYTAGPCTASIRDATHTSIAPNCVYIEANAPNSDTAIAFPVQIPNGALVNYIDLYYYDNDATYNPSLGFWYTTGYGSMTMVQALTPGAYTAGNRMVRFGPFSHTVSNWDRAYMILAILSRGASTTNRLYGFNIWYRLVVSPAPATATFGDVPTTHPFFQYIEALVKSGVTAGCGGGNYCPDSPLTRGQMAVFLSRSLGLHWAPE